jgi:hypothetical protein
MKRRFLIGPVVAVALVFLYLWPVWVLEYRFPFGGGDLWGQLYPVWSFVSEWVRRGVFPLWNNRMMGGDPIIAEPQYGLLNPLNWPLFLMSPIPKWAVLLRGSLPLAVGGVGMYVLLRSPRWRLGYGAAVIGVAAYMLSDPFLTHLGHPQINDGLAWLPWSFLAVDRAVERRRWAMWTVLPIAMLGVCGHIQTALLGAAALVLYALWRCLEPPLASAPRRLGSLLLTGGIALSITLPVLLPALERYPLSDRAGMPLLLVSGYHWPLEMVVDLLSPWFHGRGARYFWGNWGRIESAYVGAVALYLAVPGLLADVRRSRSRFLWVMGVLAGLFALGFNGPLGPLIAKVELLTRMGKTGRAAYLVSFVLAVGAALGFHHLRRSPGLRRATALALGGVGLLLWVSAPWMAARVPPGGPFLRAVGGLRAAAALAWVLVPALLLFPTHLLWRVVPLVLLTTELVASGSLVEVEPDPMPVDHAAALAFLRADPGWFRVDVDPGARNLWPPASLQTAGFEVPQGVGNPMELREFNVLRWSIPSATSPAYRMLGVKYIVVPKDVPPGGEGIWPVFVDDPTVDIHLNTSALPRVWLIYRTEVVGSYGEALQRVLDDRFRPEEVAIVQDGPYLNGRGNGRIEVGYYGPNRIVVYVETSAPALLVLSDTFYPGWRAAVDGNSVPIYQTNVAFRGILVPAGTHWVEMWFWPQRLWVGMGLASVAVVAGAVVTWVEGRARRQRGSAVRDVSSP